MRRINLLLFLLFMLTILPIDAQIQTGYVRTLGRSDKAGEPLSGVTIRARGEHNSTLSGDDGKFNLVMAGKKNGEAYYIQQVQKNDYELNEPDLIGQPLGFSDKVTLTIVMVSTKQLQADKQRIVDNAYAAAARNYDAKLKTMEKQLNDKQISIEQYRMGIQDLQGKFQKYQTLIDELAEHYAHADYDLMNEKEREINLCIENGELERADSLINLIFDPDALQRNIEALSRLDQERNLAYDMLAQSDADWAAVLKQQEKDAEYLYQLYTIELLRFNNEKALQYIKTRAALDTTNAVWQIQAGQFVERYQGNDDEALIFYRRALRNAQSHPQVAACYNNIGQVLVNYKGDVEQGLEFLQEASEIWKSFYGEAHHDVALSYNNIGWVYLNLGQAKNDVGSCYSALQYCQKALDIWEHSGASEEELAACCNNIGCAYLFLGNNKPAKEYLFRSLKMREKLYGENHFYLVEANNNIGSLFASKNDTTNALKYYRRALEISQKVYGNTHLSIAAVYHNIGDMYFNLEEGDKALHNYENAVKSLGKNHPDLYSTYVYDIGSAYLMKTDITNALKNYRQFIELRKGIDDTRLDVAFRYYVIGYVFASSEEFDTALLCFNEALRIYKKNPETDASIINEVNHCIKKVKRKQKF